MGKAAKVVSIERDQSGALNITCDPGGGALITALHFADAGDDSAPVPGDYVALEDSPGAGATHVSGYHDTANAGVATAGEKRLIARTLNGTPVAQIYLKNDGTGILVEIMNSGTAPIRIKSAGPIIVDSPDVRVGDENASQPIARVGDLVAVTVPSLICAAPGSPAVPVPPTAITPTGGYVAAGQIISGSSRAKAT